MSAEKTELARLFESFEGCCFQHHGVDAWSARKLMPLFGYDKWERFRGAINRAWESCAAIGVDSSANFLQPESDLPWLPDEVFPGAGKNPQGGRPSEDVLLTRRAAYLVTMNGDPRKPEIAFAQHYFATATRTLEKLQQRMIEAERLIARGELTETEAHFQGVLYEHGVDGAGIGKIRSRGDYILFGGNDTAAMKRKWGITSKSKPLADHAPLTAIRAKQLSSEMTTHNVMAKKLYGENPICGEHEDNTQALRDMLTSRGIYLEKSAPEEDIKKIERRHASEVRQLSKPEKPKKAKDTQADQSKRFIEKARELECDEDPDAFHRAVRKVATAKVEKVKPKANPKNKGGSNA